MSATSILVIGDNFASGKATARTRDLADAAEKGWVTMHGAHIFIGDESVGAAWAAYHAQLKANNPQDTARGHELQAKATALLAKAAPETQRTSATLSALFGAENVTARVKSVNSMVKQNQSWEAAHPGDLTPLRDIIGTRVTVPDLAAFGPAIDAIRANFHVTRETNYEDHPIEGGYRAHHFNFEQNGVLGEIQLRTPSQTKWGDWMHDSIYKMNGTPEKIAAIQANMPIIQEYARSAADAYYAHDKGAALQLPDCTEAVASTVGCL